MYRIVVGPRICTCVKSCIKKTNKKTGPAEISRSTRIASTNVWKDAIVQTDSLWMCTESVSQSVSVLARMLDLNSEPVIVK